MIGQNFLNPLTTTVDQMAPATGPLWAHFHQSETKPNGVHFRATHWRCIDARRPPDEPIDVDASVDVTLIKNAEWFAEGA
jgi:hypothetical protein